MSSSRSVAAARQRRAGDAVPQQQQPARGPQQSMSSQQIFAQQQQQQQQRPSYSQYQQPQGQGQGQRVPRPQQQDLSRDEHMQKASPALTIPQAITLISLRIGRLEGAINKIHRDGVSLGGENLGGENQEGNENIRLIDESILNNIFTRLQTIETTRSSASTNNASNFNESNIKALNDKILSLQGELRDAKEAISKLQIFTMDTNQKLLNVVLQQGTSTFSLPLAEMEEEVTLEDVNEDDDGEDYNATTNLKEFIQMELENNNS